MDIINQFSAAASSGTVGLVGLATLFIIGICTGSIEGSFNSLWGVERGRKLGERIVTYWTFISLRSGTVAITLLAANAFVTFASDLPRPMDCRGHTARITSDRILLSTLLAIFFRFIPNTQVEWKPAFFGGRSSSSC